MANVSVFNMEGKEVGSMELNDAVFGVEVNEHLVHMAVLQQLANKRQGPRKVFNNCAVERRRSCFCSDTKRLFFQIKQERKESCLKVSAHIQSQ